MKPKSKTRPRPRARDPSHSDVGATDATESAFEVLSSEGEKEMVEIEVPVATEDEGFFTEATDGVWPETSDGDYELVSENALNNFNPESPPMTPRANWTEEDFARLSNVMADLQSLNQKLLAFVPDEPEDAEEVSVEAAEAEPATRAFGQVTLEGPGAKVAASGQVYEVSLSPTEEEPSPAEAPAPASSSCGLVFNNLGQAQIC